MSLEKLHQVRSVVVYGRLQRSVAQLVSQAAVGAGSQQNVDALYVSSHAGYVERRVSVVVRLIEVAANVHELLHHKIVASVARLVQWVVLVDQGSVRASPVSQEVPAHLVAVVADGPVQRRDRKALPVLEEVADTLVHVVEPVLKERDDLCLAACLDCSEQLVVL